MLFLKALAAAAVTVPMVLGAGAQDARFVASETLGPVSYTVMSGDGVGTLVTNLLVTIEKGPKEESVAFSLDYDFRNVTEGNKSSAPTPTCSWIFSGRMAIRCRVRR